MRAYIRSMDNNKFVAIIAIVGSVLKYGAIAAYMIHTYGALSAF